MPNFVNGPIGANEALATSVRGIALSVPATLKLPSVNSMSPASASIMAAASGFAFSMMPSAARLSALPPTTALRAP